MARVSFNCLMRAMAQAAYEEHGTIAGAARDLGWSYGVTRRRLYWHWAAWGHATYSYRREPWRSRDFLPMPYSGKFGAKWRALEGQPFMPQPLRTAHKQGAGAGATCDSP